MAYGITIKLDAGSLAGWNEYEKKNKRPPEFAYGDQFCVASAL